MKKMYLVAVSFLLIGSSFSQNLTSTDISYQPGDNFNYYQSNYVNPGASGIGVTWDFSSMTTTSTTNVTISATSGGTFPTANVKVTQSPGGEVYYNSTASVLEIVGSGTSPYFDGMEYLQFPLSGSTDFTDTYAYEYLISGQSYEKSATVHSRFSGYGTLILPTGTFTNVYRLEIEHQIADSSYSTGIVDSSTYLMYVWFKAGIHHELASVSTFTLGSSVYQSAFYSDEFDNVGLENKELKNLILYPNPAETNFTVSSDTRIESIEIYTLAGETVQTVFVNGSTNSEVGIEKLTSGFYLVKIIGVNGEVSTQHLAVN